MASCALTSTWRDKFGVNVAPNDPSACTIQIDVDPTCPYHYFNKDTTTADATWHGNHYFYYPYTSSSGPPNVAWFSDWRISISDPALLGGWTSLIIHGQNADLYVQPDGSVLPVSSVPPDSMSGGAADPFSAAKVVHNVSVLLAGAIDLLFALIGGDVMSTTAVPFLNPLKQFFDSNGHPLANGYVYTYQSGSNTPMATYSDPALTVPNANPLQLDSQGRAVMWMQPQTYRVTLTDSLGVVQSGYPIDGIPGSIWPSAMNTTVTTNPAANANSLANQFRASLNKATTGTHSLFAANYFATPTIGAGGATLTEAATVYIAGPPNLGDTKYSLHVAAGISRFEGAVQVPGGFSGNVGFYDVAPIARQLLATGAGHTVDDVITALQALGLVRQA